MYLNPLTGTLVNSEDSDEMLQNAAFYQSMHFMLTLKKTSGTEIKHNLENSTCDPLKFTVGSP